MTGFKWFKPERLGSAPGFAYLCLSRRAIGKTVSHRAPGFREGRLFSRGNPIDERQNQIERSEV